MQIMAVLSPLFLISSDFVIAYHKKTHQRVLLFPEVLSLA